MLRCAALRCTAFGSDQPDGPLEATLVRAQIYAATSLPVAPRPFHAGGIPGPCS